MQRGQIFYRLPQRTDGKPRPVVIVSRDELNGGPFVVAVPFYSQQLEKRSRQRWCVPFRAGDGGLEKDCVAKADEVSSLDKTLLDHRRGRSGG